MSPDNIQIDQDQNPGDQDTLVEGVEGEENHVQRERYPQRERGRSRYLEDYVTDFDNEGNNDFVLDQLTLVIKYVEFHKITPRPSTHPMHLIGNRQ